jgi:hypothetical protein
LPTIGKSLSSALAYPARTPAMQLVFAALEIHGIPHSHRRSS